MQPRTYLTPAANSSRMRSSLNSLSSAAASTRSGVVKPSVKSPMRGRHHVISFVAAILPAPEAREAGGGAQFQRPALLTAGDLDRAVETGLRGSVFVFRFEKVQLAAETVQFGFLKMLVILLHEREGLVQSARARRTGPPASGLRQDAEIIRQPESGAGGAICFQAFFEEAPALPPAARAAAIRRRIERARGVPEGETLLRRDPHLLFTGRLRVRAEAGSADAASPCDAGHIRG